MANRKCEEAMTLFIPLVKNVIFTQTNILKILEHIDNEVVGVGEVKGATTKGERKK